MKSFFYRFLCFLVITSILCACSVTCRNKKETEKDNHALFIKVIDGDTFEAYYQGNIEKIRLAGIDCFEKTNGDKLKSQAKRQNISTQQALKKGLEAEQKLANLLTDNSVLFVFGMEKDRYNRVLGYVYVGKKNVNQYMLYEAGCNAFSEESYYNK